MHPGGNSMIRFSRRIFTDLAIYMMGFGLVIGFVFPFFMTLLGVPVSYTMQLWFFIVCIIAGLIVGAMNILLARSVVGSRLHLIANKMKQIGGYLSSKSHEAIVATCSMQECMVEESEFQYGPQRIRITISGGVSSWPDFDASSADALVKRADESLYAAKEGGRNRVAVL